MKKIIRVLFILVALVLSAVFVLISNQEKLVPKEAIVVDAVDLWKEMKYGGNDLTEYDGLLYEITGEVAEISDSFMGHPCILLENGESTIPEGFFIMFPDGFDVSRYSIGEIVTVNGTCSPAIHIAGDDSNPTVFFYVE